MAGGVASEAAEPVQSADEADAVEEAPGPSNAAQRQAIKNMQDKRTIAQAQPAFQWTWLY